MNQYSIPWASQFAHFCLPLWSRVGILNFTAISVLSQSENLKCVPQNECQWHTVAFRDIAGFTGPRLCAEIKRARGEIHRMLLGERQIYILYSIWVRAVVCDGSTANAITP